MRFGHVNQIQLDRSVGLDAEAVGQGKGEGRVEVRLRGAQTKTAGPRSRKKEGTELVGL